MNLNRGRVSHTCVLLAAVTLTTLIPTVSGQSLPPFAPHEAQLGVKAARTNSQGIEAVHKKPDWLFPLWRANEATIKAFYTTDTWLTPVQQIRFLYGFNQSSKSLSADLASMIFPNGVQLTLGSTVTAPGKSPDPTMDSATQALERLKAGGDFFMRGVYPLIAMESSNNMKMFEVHSISTLAFNISGFGDETTITESTEHNFNSSVEAFGRYSAFDSGGYLYGAVKTGWQNVQSEFAKTTGLPHRNFVLSQISLGVQVSDYMSIGFQRFIGPEQAFGTTKDELSKWHLVVQIMPLTKKP